MPAHDRDDLDALDFYEPDHTHRDGDAGADALDFSGVDHDGGDESAVDALDEYVPAQPADESELDAIHAQAGASAPEEEDEGEAVQTFTVANPADTVSVSALIDGRTQRVELSAKVTSMTEHELAEEILVLADLARQKGLAGQHDYVLENEILAGTMRQMGLDRNEVLRDFMENGIGLPTPEQAEAAQAEVFATRYATDH
ncbi:hypothetical protein [Mycobacterium parmense]|uniref:ESX-1 secretion-associated protein EspH n=1 Tax=Mycobacterium parmense TaxID=185642 RepID=A0A7I7YY10_9MYCO|nr:hypothetical protein [Mycobacterium parmense]MCV7352750.1 hypothetical protein [Mycobacterium parmense]BBZ46758.1 ESX-1 secretion-associated protein EspH [Mycobacterium parmense]